MHFLCKASQRHQPSEGTFESWSPKDGLDYFGNLCLVQRRTNSKFSNLSPESKKGSFGDTIKNGSLKLRIMSNETITNADWKENAYKKHACTNLPEMTYGIIF